MKKTSSDDCLLFAERDVCDVSSDGVDNCVRSNAELFLLKFSRWLQFQSWPDYQLVPEMAPIKSGRAFCNRAIFAINCVESTDCITS